MYVFQNQSISQNTAFLLADIKSGLFLMQRHGKKYYFWIWVFFSELLLESERYFNDHFFNFLQKSTVR